MKKVSKLIVGVTGHIHITKGAVEGIRKELARLFYAIKQEYPNTKCILQSPLAEGADRLAAEVALEMGFTLHTPLPFEKEIYMEDFQTDRSKAEFMALLEKAEKVFIPANGSYFESREDRYFATGCYIAQSSDILLCLWDFNKELERRGGTAHIIRCQFNGFPEKYRFPEIDMKSRKTYMIYTPRDADSLMNTNSGYWSKDQYDLLRSEV